MKLDRATIMAHPDAVAVMGLMARRPDLGTATLAHLTHLLALEVAYAALATPGGSHVQATP